jgi:hypothetical protein
MITNEGKQEKKVCFGHSTKQAKDYIHLNLKTLLSTYEIQCTHYSKIWYTIKYVIKGKLCMHFDSLV